MSRLENVRNEDSITAYPESPSEVGRWAPYKNNPATFALTLAEHSGFDAVARTMTPPPSYSRHAPTPPRLTLLIPNSDENGDSSPREGAVHLSPDECAIESVSTSPADAFPPKSSEDTLLHKVKAGLRKRSTGLKSRLRRPSGGSRSSSASTSPNDTAPSFPASYSGAVGDSSHPTTPSRHLPAIQELDGQPVDSFSHRSWTAETGRESGTGQPIFDSDTSPSSRTPDLHHSPSVSSIVPTPRRGLSFATSTSRLGRASDVNPSELSGRLESLNNHAHQEFSDVIVSPCSLEPSSTMRAFQAPSSLSRSNAVTDNIMHHTPISPLSAFPRSPIGPPTTPTLDGRLDSLPRLDVPTEIHALLDYTFNNGRSQSQRIRRDVEESDSGKELASPSASAFGRLERPFNAPHWGSHTSSHHASRASIQDLGSDAPEVVIQENTTGPAPVSHDFRYYNPPYTARPYVQPNSFAALVGAVCETAASAVVASAGFLKTRYGPEPPVPDKHVRVRWRCTCGEHVYDDYIENRPGAAAALEAYLNRVPQFWMHSPGSHPSSATSAGSPVFSAGGPSPLSSISSWPSPGCNSPNSYGRDFSKQTTRVGTGSIYGLNLKSYIEPLWMYTCVNEGRWTTKMRHLDVNSSKIGSDKDLALALGSLYSSVNRKWYKFLKLRGLTTIKFVQFELHRNRFADISRSPALPNPQSPEGFTYEFTPHDLSPPVGSNYLMHLFKHPEDYDDELITYQRTPKRRDRLEIGTGWGLELVEGFMPERVWGALAALFLIGSLVFAVTWAIKRGDDVQGAFGVAGYMVGVAGLVVAWAQAVLN